MVGANLEVAVTLSFPIGLKLAGRALAREAIKAHHADVIYVLAAQQLISLSLQVVFRALSLNLKLKTIWQQAFFLDGIEPAIDDEEPYLLIVEFVAIFIIAMHPMFAISLRFLVDAFANALAARLETVSLPQRGSEGVSFSG